MRARHISPARPSGSSPRVMSPVTHATATPTMIIIIMIITLTQHHSQTTQVDMTESPSTPLVGQSAGATHSLRHIPPPRRETWAPTRRMIITLTPLADVQIPARIGEPTASVIVGVANLLLDPLGGRSYAPQPRSSTPPG